MSTSAHLPERFTALLKICDMACAHAVATQADQRAEFWETLSAALEDDCPQQSAAARDVAHSLRITDRERVEFFKLIHTA